MDRTKQFFLTSLAIAITIGIGKFPSRSGMAKIEAAISAPSPLPSQVRNDLPQIANAAKSQGAIELTSQWPEQLFDPISSPERRLELLQKKAEALSDSEWRKLEESFAQGKLSVAEERILLKLSILAGERAVPMLATIAGSRILNEWPDERSQSERAIRLGALEQLDILAATNSNEAKKTLWKIERTYIDPAQRPFLEVAMLGLFQHRPGKLHRMLESAYREGAGS